MALFEKMKDSISIAGQGVSQKAKSATESVRIGNLIKANDRMIDKLTHQVGIQCVNKYINDPSSEFAELFGEILRLREENRKLQQELQLATAVNSCPHCGFGNNMAAKFCISCGAPLSAVPNAAAGGRTCPNCGAANTMDASFCVECGAPISPAAPAPIPTPPVGGRTCPNCGYSNAEDVAFCVECGTPMPLTAADPVPTPEAVVEPAPAEKIVNESVTEPSSPVSLCKNSAPVDAESTQASPLPEAEEASATEAPAAPVVEAAPPVNLCKNCGAVLDEDSLFCTECGTRRD